MSIAQCQNAVNSLDKEIANLEKRKAAKDKDISTLQGKINSIKKSITKYTPLTSLNSKQKQIETYESEKAKKSKW